MNLSAACFEAARVAQTSSAPVSSEVSPKQVVAPSASILSMRLPTVGLEARPDVVSLSPHFVEMNSSSMPHSSDRKSTRLNSSHPSISYAVFCLKKKKNKEY